MGGGGIVASFSLIGEKTRVTVAWFMATLHGYPLLFCVGSFTRIHFWLQPQILLLLITVLKFSLGLGSFEKLKWCW